ncbi:MFS transporter (macronuclear) [Tetrahymena thermophila SB210]|uniref:Lysosomal dipeptide transporter MFSD1 n=1 Tax=Tetrahymena thermophila (strain SB210) TaxID=312017 RepID=I7M0R0_TETTS|nr:MFS transporter [Tetrahymena thermophila SB210]EAR90770.2 MFS transporter [Tetrahymena thermophila SB210]|eukprot:XP_001011015.2 MFS transporter [Tetrahymena thermophila SB210]
MKNPSLQGSTAKQHIRFLILILSCMAIFSDYYIIDIPAVIQMQLVDYFAPIYGKENTEILYSFLYTIYSLPNVILPLFGGVLTDKIGYRKMTIVFVFFITLGQVIISMGMKFRSLELMIFGRFVFGIGGESVNICINTLIVNWFQGSELSFAQSINLSMIRVASILNTFLTPRIAEYRSMNTCFTFGVFVCLFSMFSSILLVYLDYKLNNQGLVDQIMASQPQQQVSNWEYIKNIFKKIQKNTSKFTQIFWVLTCLMVSLYITVISFNTFSSSILTDLWLPKENSVQRNQEIAGEMMSVPYIMACLLFPVFGLICDKYGQRVRLLIFSSFLTLISFILLPFVYPITSLAILGFSYAIFGAVIWPTVSYVVPSKRLGIGYGLMSSIQNLGTGLMPLIIAFIKVQGNSITVVITFLVISLVSIYLSFVLQRIDSQQKISLNEADQNLIMLNLEENNKSSYRSSATSSQQENEFKKSSTNDEEDGLISSNNHAEIFRETQEGIENQNAEFQDDEKQTLYI